MVSPTRGKVLSREFSPRRTAVGLPGALAGLCWVNSPPWSESQSQNNTNLRLSLVVLSDTGALGPAMSLQPASEFSVWHFPLAIALEAPDAQMI